MILGPSYPRISEVTASSKQSRPSRSIRGENHGKRIVCCQVDLEPTQPTLAELSSAATADQHVQSRIFCLSMRLACLWELPRHVVTRLSPVESEGRVHTPSQRQTQFKVPESRKKQTSHGQHSIKQPIQHTTTLWASIDTSGNLKRYTCIRNSMLWMSTYSEENRAIESVDDPYGTRPFCRGRSARKDESGIALRRNACQGTFLRSVGYTVTDLADRRRRRDMEKAAGVRRSQHLVLAQIYGRRLSFNSYHPTVMVCLIQHLYSFHGEGVWTTSVMVPYNGRLHHKRSPEDGASSKIM